MKPKKTVRIKHLLTFDVVTPEFKTRIFAPVLKTSTTFSLTILKIFLKKT